MGQLLVAITLLLVWFAAPVRAESQLERGRYLVETLAGCGNCHTPRGPNGPLKDKKFAGGEIIKHADFTAVTPNITPDPRTGIGNWTDDQIALAIREGRRPDGGLLGPAMPSRSYRSLADEDVKAIVAYLRSVPPVDNPTTAESHYDVPLPASWGPAGRACRCAAEGGQDRLWQVSGWPSSPLHGLSYRATTAWGSNTVGGWRQGVPRSVGHIGFGEPHAKRARRMERCRNRTCGPYRCVRDGHKLFPPMPFAAYKNIADDDMAALIAYLRSLPAIECAGLSTAYYCNSSWIGRITNSGQSANSKSTCAAGAAGIDAVPVTRERPAPATVHAAWAGSPKQNNRRHSRFQPPGLQCRAKCSEDKSKGQLPDH